MFSHFFIMLIYLILHNLITKLSLQMAIIICITLEQIIRFQLSNHAYIFSICKLPKHIYLYTFEFRWIEDVE